jgi:pyruvate dehydrogenase E2 component (dihydrolipoamide acetyltransferase)
MVRWEFKLPDIGEGITEGEIVTWLVEPGDAVREDQPMVEVMTDKATVTITAPKAGTVVETRGRVGEIVAVHSVLVVFDLEGEASARSDRANGAANERNSSTAMAGSGARASGLETVVAVPAARGEARYFNEKPLATPATRKLARDMSIDLRRVPPSGPQGRVTRVDLESFARTPALQASTPSPPAAPHAGSGRDQPRADSGSLEERVPFSGLRRKIAQKMATSTQTAAHFTFVEECDVTALKAMRARLVGPAQEQGAKLTFLPFIVKAVTFALKKHPMLNVTLDQSTNEIVFRKYFHVGVATATDAGLVVVVVRDADRKSILDIARDIDRMATDARAGRARVEDLQGSTFTVTSLGAQSGLLATPIINFPEVGILGVHRIKERAVVKNGQIGVGDVMLLSLSFDHRIVDGHVGAAFAYEIIGYLEAPERLILEMA